MFVLDYIFFFALQAEHLPQEQFLVEPFLPPVFILAAVITSPLVIFFLSPDIAASFICFGVIFLSAIIVPYFCSFRTATLVLPLEIAYN